MTTSESSTTLKNFEMDWLAAEEKLMQLEQPELDLASRYKNHNKSNISLLIIVFS